MSLFEAKIDCIVDRPFVYGFIKYQNGDIFKYNPNNIHLKKLYKTKRFYELTDDMYKLIICCDYPKTICGKVYIKGDELSFGVLDNKTIMLLIRRGCLKKVLKSNYDVSQAEHKTSALNDQQTASELINNETSDEKITLSTIAIKANIKASMLKAICNDDLKMGIGNYTKQLTKEQEQEILSHIDKIRKEE